MYKLTDIVHETPDYWVWHKPSETGWYEVLRKGSTHSMRVSLIHFPSNPYKARQQAVAKCEELQSRLGVKQS